jgi:acyl transferase domain-containing protein
VHADDGQRAAVASDRGETTNLWRERSEHTKHKKGDGVGRRKWRGWRRKVEEEEEEELAVLTKCLDTPCVPWRSDSMAHFDASAATEKAGGAAPGDECTGKDVFKLEKCSTA